VIFYEVKRDAGNWGRSQGQVNLLFGAVLSSHNSTIQWVEYQHQKVQNLIKLDHFGFFLDNF
jgi:hypothetical protein